MITLRRVIQLNCFIYMIHIIVYSLYTIFIYLDLINEYLYVGLFIVSFMFGAMWSVIFLPNAIAQLPNLKFEWEVQLLTWFYQIGFLLGGIGMMWVMTFYALSEIGEVMEWTWLSEIPYHKN